MDFFQFSIPSCTTANGTVTVAEPTQKQEILFAHPFNFNKLLLFCLSLHGKSSCIHFSGQPKL